ncbi:MAG: aminoacetone oxidase family FAD-binding enzyme, partial [Eubacteriales bacterium]
MITYGQWGHLGGACSLAEILSGLYFHEMKLDPEHPHMEQRDRLILSKAHASPALDAALELAGFMPKDTMEFFESHGVPLKVERGNRVFPLSDKAVDVVDALHSFALDKGAKILHARAKELVIEKGAVKGVLTDTGEKLFADFVLIATGGVSYPLTGSTGDGYELAKQAGHTITELNPSLVPLVAHEGFCSALQGLSLRNVAIKVIDANSEKEIFSDFGEMLFTHFGVSGPLILSASSHMRNMTRGKYSILIDLKPALTQEQLDARILRDFAGNSNKNFINALNLLLPKKLVPVIVKLSGIEPGLKTNQITKEQRQHLVDILKAFKVTITAFRPIEEAIITSGGVKTGEINPKTMQSKLVSGLYFAGEVIDADAYTGGFNLQIAFATGNLAGLQIGSSQ